MKRKRKKRYTLGEIRKLLTDEQMVVASESITNAEFMEMRLAELRKKIEEEGMDEEYQYGSKPTASMDLYLKISKQYGVTIRYLSDLVSESPKQPEGDELLEFLRG